MGRHHSAVGRREKRAAVEDEAFAGKTGVRAQEVAEGERGIAQRSEEVRGMRGRRR